MSQEKNEKNVNRQDWKPHWGVDLIYKIWLAVFAGIKVAVGAVATVLLICVVCAFAVVNILGEYLETDILPTANLVLENYEMDAPSYVYSVNEAGEIVAPESKAMIDTFIRQALEKRKQ